MNKSQFAKLFEAALAASRSQAEASLGRKLPLLPTIKLVAFGQDDKWISVEDCLEFIYIDDSNFYRFIDVAVIAHSKTHTGYFVRVSGHAPGNLALTWQPEGLGPFKVMGSMEQLKPLAD